MSYGESKAKLGNRGSIRGEKTFNQSSGTRGRGGADSPQTEWSGKTKGDTKSKKQS